MEPDNTEVTGHSCPHCDHTHEHEVLVYRIDSSGAELCDSIDFGLGSIEIDSYGNWFVTVDDSYEIQDRTWDSEEQQFVVKLVDVVDGQLTDPVDLPAEDDEFPDSFGIVTATGVERVEYNVVRVQETDHAEYAVPGLGIDREDPNTTSEIGIGSYIPCEIAHDLMDSIVIDVAGFVVPDHMLYHFQTEFPDHGIYRASGDL